MAYSSTTFGPIGSVNGTTLWLYSSADAIATVNTSGYFNTESDRLSVRDVIMVIDTNVPTTNFVNVLSNSAGVVDVSDGTAIVETDGD